MPSMMFIGNFTDVAIAVVGGLRVASGSMSLGDVQAFIQYSRQFTQPLTQLASMANVMQSGWRRRSVFHAPALPAAGGIALVHQLDGPFGRPDRGNSGERSGKRSRREHVGQRCRWVAERHGLGQASELFEHVDVVTQRGVDRLVEERGGRDRERLHRLGAPPPARRALAVRQPRRQTGWASAPARWARPAGSRREEPARPRAQQPPRLHGRGGHRAVDELDGPFGRPDRGHAGERAANGSWGASTSGSGADGSPSGTGSGRRASSSNTSTLWPSTSSRARRSAGRGTRRARPGTSAPARRSHRLVGPGGAATSAANGVGVGTGGKRRRPAGSRREEPARPRAQRGRCGSGGRTEGAAASARGLPATVRRHEDHGPQPLGLVGGDLQHLLELLLDRARRGAQRGGDLLELAVLHRDALARGERLELLQGVEVRRDAGVLLAAAQLADGVADARARWPPR